MPLLLLNLMINNILVNNSIIILVLGNQ